ncbi:MAG TPA: UTP--glucose-1-phosphate uridylyltransferase GalU [Thermodesulfovibrionales bacterium]|jgi:UTP--glucose-1-phosphate uridylyltransferase|nr:UTP--glucose-1-phosphate uridylyltransferase GalU [Thermodesulfovibrionales bacterium]
MEYRVKKAIFPAAGLGTRFLPATKASPKEMLPIVDKPMIQYAVEEAIYCGIEEIIVITGKHKRAIEDHFDSAYELEEKLKVDGKKKLLDEVKKLSHINLAYIRQGVALGLGHAILCAKPFVRDEPFAVILSDDVIEPDYHLLKDMIRVYEEVDCPVIALEEVPDSDVSRYGIIDGVPEGDVYRISSLVEKPKKEEAPSNLAIIGRYILTPDIFRILERQRAGAGGEIQLTDALKELLKKRSIFGYPIKGRRYDAGDKVGFLKATVDFALKNPEVSGPFTAYIKEVAEGLSSGKVRERAVRGRAL